MSDHELPEDARDAPSSETKVPEDRFDDEPPPTEEELAATHAVIMAVLAEQAARGAERVEPPVDLWRRSGRGMRATVAAGPGAWAASRDMRGC